MARLSLSHNADNRQSRCFERQTRLRSCPPKRQETDPRSCLAIFWSVCVSFCPFYVAKFITDQIIPLFSVFVNRQFIPIYQINQTLPTKISTANTALVTISQKLKTAVQNQITANLVGTERKNTITDTSVTKKNIAQDKKAIKSFLSHFIGLF